MAEEFALQKSHRNRGAVQLYEGSIPAFTASMDGARDDFLARSCFALDENCGVRGRHRANQVQRFHQSRAAPDDSFKCLLLGEVLLAKLMPTKLCASGKAIPGLPILHPPAPSLHSVLTTSTRLVKLCSFLSWSMERTPPCGQP